MGSKKMNFGTDESLNFSQEIINIANGENCGRPKQMRAD